MRRRHERVSSHSAPLSLFTPQECLLHLLEGQVSRVIVAPSAAGPSMQFLQMKEKMKADVEGLFGSISGPKGTQAELTAAMDQLRRGKGICWIIFEGMLTRIHRTLESEAPVATIFDWLHRMRNLFFLWVGWKCSSY